MLTQILSILDYYISLMGNKKYSKDIDSTCPVENPSFIKSKRVNDVEATIRKVKFEEKTRDSISRNANHNLYSPKVLVKFETDTTSLWGEFVVDNLVRSYYNFDKSKKFTSLVSSSYVEWGNLGGLIGSQTTIESPMDHSEIHIQDPLDSHNYNVLAEVDKNQIYQDGFSNYFVDVFVDCVKNRVVGTASIKDINVNSNRVNVVFELSTGATFSDTFPIKRGKNQRKDSSDGYLSYNRKSSERPYDFWDLCEDSLGYIPADSKYEKIIGEKVDVEYNGNWSVDEN